MMYDDGPFIVVASRKEEEPALLYIASSAGGKMLLKSGGLLLSRIPLVSSSFRTSKICMRKMSTKNMPTPTPVYPEFIPVEQNQITSVSKSEGIKFRVVSYNILAQVYVKSSVFPHSPSPCLKWKARSPIILDLLKHLDADILCLQELDEYDSFYKEKIEQNDYSSIYIKRSGRKSDGCGIFYKHNKLELVTEETIDYNDLANLLLDEASRVEQKEKDLDSKGKGDANDPYVRLKRDCVGVMAAFKFKKPYQHYIIVANTHLYWDPEWADVKLAQAKYLLSRVAKFKKMVSENFECTPSVIITGDFNSIPGDKVYQYLVSGGSMECLEDELTIKLSSVYACTRGEPRFTNYTPGFTGTLDYIFFSPSDHGIEIEPVSYLELPEAESADVTGGLPNYYHPSDHLPIGAEFLVV